MSKVLIILAILIGLPLSILGVNAWRKANNLNQQALEERGKLLAEFDRYRERLLAGNYEQIYNDASPEFRQKSTLQQFQETFEGFRRQNGRLLEITRHGGQARFQTEAWTGVIDATYSYEKKQFLGRHIYHRQGSAWVLYAVTDPPNTQ